MGRGRGNQLNATAFGGGGGRAPKEIDGISIIDPETPPDIGSEMHRRRIADYVFSRTGRINTSVAFFDRCTCNHRLEDHSDGLKCSKCDCKKHIPAGGSFTDMKGNITVQSDRPPQGTLAEREIVINALARHEVCHELYTDPAAFRLFTEEMQKLHRNQQEVTAQILPRLFNILEDGRIETIERAKVPGSYRFISAMNKLWNRIGEDTEVEKDYEILLESAIDYVPTDANGKKLKIITKDGHKYAVIPAGSSQSPWSKKPVSLRQQMDAALLAEALPEFEVKEIHPKVEACLDECREHIDAALSGNTSDAIARTYAVHAILKKHGLVEEDMSPEEREEMLDQIKKMQEMMQELGQQQDQEQNQPGNQSNQGQQPQQPMNGIPQPVSGPGESGDGDGDQGEGQGGSPGGQGGGQQGQGDGSGGEDPSQIPGGPAGSGGSGGQQDSDMPESLKNALENGATPDANQTAGGESGGEDQQQGGGSGGNDSQDQNGGGKDGDQDGDGKDGDGQDSKDGKDGDQDSDQDGDGKDGDGKDGKDGDGKDGDGKDGQKGDKQGDGGQEPDKHGPGPGGKPEKNVANSLGSTDPSKGFNPNAHVPKEDRLRHEREKRGSVSSKELKEMKKAAEQQLASDKSKQAQANNRKHNNNQFEASDYNLDVGSAITQKELTDSYRNHGGALTDEQGELNQYGQSLARKLKKIQTEARAPKRRRLNGRLDTRGFSRGLAGDPKVYYHPGKSIDLDMEIDVNMDRSGSIDHNQEKNQYRMAKMLAHAAEATKIPITIYGWDGGYNRVTHYAYKERHSNDVKGIDALFQTGGGGTPTQEGVRLARRRLANSKSQNKIMVVLTDGMSNSPEETKEQVEAARREGIQVLAMGLAAGVSPDMMEEQFGSNNWTIIEDFIEAPKIVGNLIEQAALKMRGP